MLLIKHDYLILSLSLLSLSLSLSLSSQYSYNVAMVVEVPPLALVPNFIVQSRVLKPFRHQTGGTVLVREGKRERERERERVRAHFTTRQIVGVLSVSLDGNKVCIGERN